MRKNSEQLVWAIAICSALTTGATGLAATLIEDYDGFNLTGTYQSWDNFAITTITSGPTSYKVDSVGFGGGFFDLNPQINATGETEIALDVTVDAASSLPGVILALVDGDGTLENYAWYALTDGNHLLTKTIGMTSFPGAAGSIPGLDLSTLDFFHIQVDGQVRYSVSFNNLELTTPVPEPSSCVLAAGGLLGLLSLRRSRRAAGKFMRPEDLRDNSAFH